MNRVGSEGDFGGSGVEDVFLAGFEAWGELGQMQGPLLGSGSVQHGGGSAGGLGVGVGGIGSPGTVGGRAPPGIGSMTGLGGSMQSFLGEAGMYPESADSGTDSMRDEYKGRDNSNNYYHNNSNDNSSGSGSGSCSGSGSGSSNGGGGGSARFFMGGGGGSGGTGTGGGLGRYTDQCKMEPIEQHEHDEHEHDEHDHEHEHEHDLDQDQDEEDQDEFCHDSEDDHDNDDHDDNHHYGGEDDGGMAGDGGDGGGQHQGSVRGLGRIFGMGTHPVVAEAQARAEALVHGRGARGSGSNSAAEAAEKKRKRAVLSKEERAKQNRDRNREHARNTRLRKKAFVEELKKQVEELVASREREDSERRAETRRESSLRDIRIQVLLTFLEYRGRAETGRKEWQSVLDEQFEMRMPITPYRTFPPHQVQGGMRVIKGVDGVLADTLSLNVATKAASASGRTSRHETLSSTPAGSERKGKAKTSDSRKAAAASGGSPTGMSFLKRGAMSSPDSCSEGEGERVAAGPAVAAAVAAATGVVPSPNRVYYVVDPKEIMGNKSVFMCPFLARSPQLLVPGMLRCTFSAKSNRLSSLQLSFDPTVPARQLARAAMLQGRATPGMAGMMSGMMGMGGVDGTAGPGAAATAAADAAGSRVVVTAETGATSSQAFVGQDEGVLHSVLEDIREWRVSSTLVDDPKQGKSYLRVYPLSGDVPGVTHFIGVLESLGSGQAAAGAGGEPVGTSNSSPLDNEDPLMGGSSSGLEAGASEGETSSDSTSSTAKGGISASADSGSGGSDYGTGNHSSRSSRTVSGCTTTGSDGGFSSSLSSYDTRRSTRRLHTKDSASPASAGTTIGIGGGIGIGLGIGVGLGVTSSNNAARERVRGEGPLKRARS